MSETITRLNDPDIICGLRRCPTVATHRLEVGGYSVILCWAHFDELQWKVEQATGYSTCAPAKGYRSHWPWKVTKNG